MVLGNESYAVADLEARIASLTEQLTLVEEKLAQSENDKVTLQQRVELLLVELQSNDSQGSGLSRSDGIKGLTHLIIKQVTN